MWASTHALPTGARARCECEWLARAPHDTMNPESPLVPPSTLTHGARGWCGQVLKLGLGTQAREAPAGRRTHRKGPGLCTVVWLPRMRVEGP